MKENDAIRLIKNLLDSEGCEWAEERGWLRFRVKHDAMLWETACMVRDRSAVFYGRFPFGCSDLTRARRICNEINGQILRGALFIEEDGHPVYRCRADVDDVYNAEDRIMAAIRYNAQVMSGFWGRLSGI